MTKTKTYYSAVETKEVAGMRNPGLGEPIELTEEQAEHPLRIGSISTKAPEPEKKADQKKD